MMGRCSASYELVRFRIQIEIAPVAVKAAGIRLKGAGVCWLFKLRCK